MQIPFFVSDGEGEKWLRDHPYYCAKPFYYKAYKQDNKVSWWTNNEFNSFNYDFNFIATPAINVYNVLYMKLHTLIEKKAPIL